MTEVLRNESEIPSQVVPLKAFPVFCILKTLQPPLLFPLNLCGLLPDVGLDELWARGNTVPGLI